jgi:hypothetical protein
MGILRKLIDRRVEKDAKKDKPRRGLEINLSLRLKSDLTPVIRGFKVRLKRVEEEDK